MLLTSPALTVRRSRVRTIRVRRALGVIEAGLLTGLAAPGREGTNPSYAPEWQLKGKCLGCKGFRGEAVAKTPHADVA
jgi:hypothetical protein